MAKIAWLEVQISDAISSQNNSIYDHPRETNLMPTLTQKLHSPMTIQTAWMTSQTFYTAL
jgi:hypothetical protein